MKEIIRKIAIVGNSSDLGDLVIQKEELYCEICKDYTEHEKGEITKCSVCGTVYRDVKRYVICGKPDHPEVIKAREALLAKEPDVIIIDEDIALKHQLKGFEFKKKDIGSTPDFPLINYEEVIDRDYMKLSKRERNAKVEPVRTEPKYQRNEPCPCGKVDGNGKRLKYKKCCGKLK